jgi:hypothetical protein
MLSSEMDCAERERLIEIYFEAVKASAKAGSHLSSDMRSEGWRDATEETRERCVAALMDLNAHRKEHGC